MRPACSAKANGPGPGSGLAQLVETLFAHYQIRLLAFDIVFAEAERNPALAALDTLALGALRDDAAFQQHWADLRLQLTGDERLAASFRDRAVVMGYYFAMPGQQGGDLRVGQLPPAAAPMTVLDHSPNPFATAAGYSANLAQLQTSATGGGFFNSTLLDPDGLISLLAVAGRL